MALPFQLGADDLVDVEEAVLLEADLDERGLHAGQHVVDDALVDVAGDRAAAGALEVHLGEPVVLEDGDALLGHVHGDEQLALRLRERLARLLAAARLGAPRARFAGLAGSPACPASRPAGRPSRPSSAGGLGSARAFGRPGGGGALTPLAAAASAATATACAVLAVSGGRVWSRATRRSAGRLWSLSAREAVFRRVDSVSER